MFNFDSKREIEFGNRQHKSEYTNLRLLRSHCFIFWEQIMCLKNQK